MSDLFPYTTKILYQINQNKIQSSTLNQLNVKI